MKKQDQEEVVLLNIERNPLVLLFSVGLTIFFVFLTYSLIFAREVQEVQPLGFFLLVPTLLVFFQSLWYLLNPFAVIFEERVEIKQSFFHNKFWYFVDIKQVGELREGTFLIVYNDDEVEKMNLFGIKSSHRNVLREAFKKQMLLHIHKRVE
jgi:hypothetical protein